MKNIILLIAVVIVVGCGKDNQTAKEAPKETPSNNSTAKPTKDKTNKETPPKEDAKKATPPEGDDNNSTEIKPKKLTAEEEKVAGGYERIINEDGDTIRKVLLENGNTEGYVIPSLDNSYKTGEKNKWSISKEGEIHVINDFGMIEVYRINKDVSITLIAWIYKGLKRGDIPKEEQVTFKKIKLDTAAENKKHNVVVGSYEAKIEEDTILLLTINKRNKSGWKIVGKELQVKDGSKISVYRIEANGDLTEVAKIEDGERADLPKEKQITFKKIK